MKRNLLLVLFVGVFLSGVKAKGVALHRTLAAVKTTTVILDGFITIGMTDAASRSIVMPIKQQYAGQYDYTIDWVWKCLKLPDTQCDTCLYNPGDTYAHHYRWPLLLLGCTIR